MFKADTRTPDKSSYDTHYDTVLEHNKYTTTKCLQHMIENKKK